MDTPAASATSFIVTIGVPFRSRTDAGRISIRTHCKPFPLETFQRAVTA